jgi:hypothetical protein
MAVLKHRKFNADRFIDKFAGHEPVLADHMARWPSLVPPAPLTPASFKDYLRAPHENDAAFEDMVDGLYQAYDFCTKQGHELLGEAVDINQLELPGIHELPREVLALRLQILDPETFSLACDLLFASQVDKFVTYKGREARQIPDVDTPLAIFRTTLGERFKERKGSDRIVVRHFTDGTAHNFIVYHERRVTAELELVTGAAEAVVDVGVEGDGGALARLQGATGHRSGERRGDYSGMFDEFGNALPHAAARGLRTRNC